MLNDANLQPSGTNGAPELPGVTTTKPRGGKNKNKRAEGRKSADGSAAVLRPKTVMQAGKELMSLFKRKQEANAAYNAAAKAVAERSGFNTSAITRIVNASARAKFEDVKRHIEQTNLLFEECGEIPGGSVTNSDPE